MRIASSRAKGFWAFGLASLGVLWTAAMIPGAFFIPVYGTSGSEPVDGTLQAPPDTLVGVNGTWVVWPLLVPVVLSIVAWLGLRASCTTGSDRGRKTGNIAACLLFGAVVLGFSLGLLEIPAALAVIVAALLTPHAARTAQRA